MTTFDLNSNFFTIVIGIVGHGEGGFRYKCFLLYVYTERRVMLAAKKFGT